MKEKIEHLAEQWAIDYKPWDTNLDYREYAQEGYVQGYSALVERLEELESANEQLRKRLNRCESVAAPQYFKWRDKWLEEGIDDWEGAK